MTESTDAAAVMSSGDLGALKDATTLTLLESLASLYANNAIYSAAGPLLLSINPLESLCGLFDDPLALGYQTALSPDHLAQMRPHVYRAVEHARMAAMRSQHGGQAVVFLGESGSGKTFAFRRSMDYLLRPLATSEPSDAAAVNALAAKGLAAVSLVEAFANASTMTNANSTRCGTLWTASLSPETGLPQSLQLATQMLERRRSVETAPDTSNFHVFYALLSAPDALLESLSLSRNSNEYEYLRDDGSGDSVSVSSLSRNSPVPMILSPSAHRRRAAAAAAATPTTTTPSTASSASTMSPSNRRRAELLNSALEAAGALPSDSATHSSDSDSNAGATVEPGDLKKSVRSPQQPSAEDSGSTPFVALQQHLAAIGIAAEQQESVFSMLACLVHLGNVSMGVDAAKKRALAPSLSNTRKVSAGGGSTRTPSKASIPDSVHLDAASRMLGMRPATLAKHLTQRAKSVSRASDRYVIHLSVEEARQTRNALVSGLYEQLFLWIVHEINQACKSPVNKDSAADPNSCFVSLLDAFGFETLHNNGLEQLCVNLFNERLHQMYIDNVLLPAQSAYQESAEGIAAAESAKAAAKSGESLSSSSSHHAKITRNEEALKLILGTPVGLLYFVDEATQLALKDPRELVVKLRKECAANSAFLPGRKEEQSSNQAPRFAVQHFAGAVTYNTTEFLQDNLNTVHPDLIDSLETCATAPFALHLLQLLKRSIAHGGLPIDEEALASAPTATAQDNEESNNSNSAKPSLSRKSSLLARGAAGARKITQASSSQVFRKGMKLILERLSRAATPPHIVLCLRPNATATPRDFQHAIVGRQLRARSIAPLVHFTRPTFAYHAPIRVFLRTYWIAMGAAKKVMSVHGSKSPVRRSSTDGSKSSVRRTSSTDASTAAAPDGTVESSDGKAPLARRSSAERDRQRLETLLDTFAVPADAFTIKAGTHICFGEKQSMANLNQARDIMLTGPVRVLQRHWRYGIARRRFLKHKAAIVIQRHARGFVARRAYRRTRSAITIQSSWVAYRVQLEWRRAHAVTRLSAAWRSFRARQWYIFFRAARTIQTRWRAYHQRQVFVVLLEHTRCATTIQRRVRGWLVRRNWTVIAERVKENTALHRKNSMMRNAAISIQSTWKAYRNKKMHYIVLIQSVLRRHLALRDYTCKHSAAVRIQRFYRTHIARRFFIPAASLYHFSHASLLGPPPPPVPATLRHPRFPFDLAHHWRLAKAAKYIRSLSRSKIHSMRRRTLASELMGFFKSGYLGSLAHTFAGDRLGLNASSGSRNRAWKRAVATAQDEAAIPSSPTPSVSSTMAFTSVPSSTSILNGSQSASSPAPTSATNSSTATRKSSSRSSSITTTDGVSHAPHAAVAANMPSLTTNASSASITSNSSPISPLAQSTNTALPSSPSSQLTSVCTFDTEVLFSALVQKKNRHHKFDSACALVVTIDGLYRLNPKTFKLKTRSDITAIRAIFMSPHADDYIMIRFHDHDLMFECSEYVELVTVLAEAFRAQAPNVPLFNVFFPLTFETGNPVWRLEFVGSESARKSSLQYIENGARVFCPI